MYNSDMPTRAQLPSNGQLIRSTLIALVSAALILVTVILPAEYAIDPTGVGRALGLTEMGEIKAQLEQEAKEDEARAQALASNLSSRRRLYPLQRLRITVLQQLSGKTEYLFH
ncbi:hypothetical protein JCM19232_1567 [Vibrio ishigakensis]|uniref:Uncharacterized protein n=1 Tax=Vibrio ishigakensis TaxID=1481914 RepID=A0A0B8PTW3_9VIBR|nr:hypothetical protein JCM19232_1567 [Vibrio ishigakensis]